ncbi:TonB-dependent receptor domain-containing protein [Aquimarina sp. 2201CG14-23]|uniref:TonB-dependent receptor domain-containing protein n=1 Tax=Aquimarina mycalae TaxID=3040073 RepID=UPI0024782DDA|nr:TonB-dependent receptor [Aquimarina sp. 2201CG14-23]MDH7444233.1 TonB-dependent receptor [Aquimarina sp. 2201CG14-23]
MKKIALFLFFFLNYIVSAQYNVSGVIIDKTTLIPIKNAVILDTENGTTAISNNNGNFNITSNGTIKVSFPGYTTKQVTITENLFISIHLATNINQLQEVLINSLSIPSQHKLATNAVAIISDNDINRGNTIELHPVLNKVPGVFMQHGTLNTNRITIRGIGARNLFGTAGIRAYFGDIPITDGNGESSIEDLELGSIARINIHKGPSSSSYGVGLGGTILLKPEFIEYNTSQASLLTSIGSYGLQRTIAKVATAGRKSNLMIVYSNTHADGYRDNNTYNRNTVTATSTLYNAKKNNVSIIASYVNLKAGIPSSLDQEDFDNSPRQAAFTWGRSQGLEDVDYGIFGLTWKHNYNDAFTQHTSIFTSFRNNNEPRPFNILEEKSNAIGLRSRVIGNSVLFQKEWQWTAGGELFFDFYNGKTFENLYQDFPVGTGSVLGDQLSDLKEQRNYYNLFVETNLKLSDQLRFNFGIHLNQTFFDIDDNFLIDGDDSSGAYDFDPILSPKLGMNYILNTNFILFGNAAHGFSTPTTAETLLPDGEFNPDIKPEIGWNYELGTRFNFLNKKLYGSLSIYSLRVKDLLVTRRTAADNFFAINAGKTVHNGIEASLNYNMFKIGQSQLSCFVNTSIHDYKFDEFIDLDDDFSGNNLTGVPSQIINIGIDLVTKKGFYGNLNFQTVGEIPANDANTVFSEHYELLHGKIGYINTIGKHIHYDLFFGANNILDTTYASQLQINARGFGGNAPRYFYPGLPFNTYGGINIKYRL